MKYLLAICVTFFSFTLIGQKTKPVTWEFEVENMEDGNQKFTATATLDGEWAMYSQHTGEGGPVPLSFTFEDGSELIGKTKEESDAIKKMSKLFEVEVVKFKKEAVFTQIFKADKGLKSFKGSLRFMCCDESRCLPPTVVPFDVVI